MVAAGAICTNARLPFETRLLKIATELRALIGEHAPDGAAIEGVFFSANARTALKLAHVRGVALLAAAEAGIEVAEYSPLEIKMSVAGYGRADKRRCRPWYGRCFGCRKTSNRKTLATPWPWPSATPRMRPPGAGWHRGESV